MHVSDNIAHQSWLAYSFNTKRHFFGSVALIWLVEHSYAPYGFWVERDEEEEGESRNKKENKIEIFMFSFLSFWVEKNNSLGILKIV